MSRPATDTDGWAPRPLDLDDPEATCNSGRHVLAEVGVYVRPDTGTKRCRGCIADAHARRPPRPWDPSPEERERRRRREVERYREIRRQLFDHYGRACACCGEDEDAFLTIDHVNDDGAEHRREIGGSSNIYAWLVREGFPDGFQTLCRNCNYAKWSQEGGCPHGR